MRVALDGMPLAQLKTGVGIYTFELTCALASAAPQDNFELVSPLPFQDSILAEAKPANLELVYYKPNLLERRWWIIGLPAYLRRSSFELFHGTNYDVPLRESGPTIVTIHDLSPLLHSSTHEASSVRRARFRLPLMAHKATLIVTHSKLVRTEVCGQLKINPDKVFAVPLAPRSGFIPIPLEETVDVRRRLGAQDKFLLCVGTIEPRKNLWTLVQALEEVLRNTDLRPNLLIAGKMGWKPEQFLSRLQKSPARDFVHLTGYLSDTDIGALYSSCSAFIYPSLYEGFGLPPLEAMACGAPVVASPVPSVIESGDKVAVVVSPDDVQDLARAIAELLSDEHARRSLSAAGLKHAAKFSWKRTAEMTREVYEEAIRIKQAQIP